MKRFFFFVLILSAPLVVQAQVPNQMVTISSDGRYLVNSITGQPVFLTGDAPQLLSLELCSMSEVNEYLADRQSRGFNAIWVILADQTDQNTAPNDCNGNAPFTGGTWWVNPNPTYWEHQDAVIQAAGALGMTVFAMPSFVGNNDVQPKYDTPSYLSSSMATVQGYGTFLGSRYKSYNNIVWVLGGDWNPTSSSGVVIKPLLEGLGAAIKAADPNHLITIEGCRNCGFPLSTSPYTSGTIPPWLSLNWTYTAAVANAVARCQSAFSSNPFLPPLLGEDFYELENGITTGFLSRQEGYWEVLSGCYLGRLFGNGPIWSFNATSSGDTSPSWQSQLGSPGSLGEQFMGKLMRSREHWLMAPDTNHSILTAGFGSGSTLSVAARSSDGQTIIAYLSDGNSTAKTIDMSAITSTSSTAIAWWYNSQTGAATLIGTFPNSGSQSFTAPDGNDWVLVIDDAAANLGAPGGGTGNNPVPSIASLSPSSAAAGGAAFTLTVNGSGFIQSSVVNFNGSARTTTFVSATQIKADILASDIATSGNANVTVTNPAPGGGTTPNFVFAITGTSNPVPTLSSISPTSAVVNGAGFTLTVNGSNFVNGSTVRFNGAAKTTTFVSSTQITAAILASDITTAGTFPVTVTNPAPGGGVSGIVNFTVNGASLSTTSISPASATAGGAAFPLTINGTGFVSGATVNFGSNPAITPSSVTSTQIVVTVPAADIATAGTVNVTVTNPGGGGTSNAQTFTINNPVNPGPTETSISPTSATAGGAGFSLTVNGTGFVSTSMVKFNGAAKATTFISATQLTAGITAADIATAGTASVTVTNPAPGGGISGALPFTINGAALSLVSIAPATATAGGTAFAMTLTGTGFVSGATVNFGSNPAITASSVTSTQIVATIPAADIVTAGSVNVTVTNPAGGGVSNPQVFSVTNPAPTEISIAPPSATAGGAAFTLTVNGAGFISTSVVKFNGVAKTTTFISSTQLTAAIAAADIATAGTATVTVTNPAPGGGTSSSIPFTISNANLVVTSLSPSSASAGGAAFTLTVTGSGFVSGATVNFGSNPAIAPSSVTSTQIVATIPAADTANGGTANVTVSNPPPGGGISSAQTFTINNPAPTAASVSPTSVTAGGAAFTLTVSGTGFVPTSVVKFNGAAKATTFVSATQLTAAITAADIAAAGTASVAVTTGAPGGGTSASIQFTINNPNIAITSLTPSSATAGGPAFTLTVNGSGFASGSVVTFNGVAKPTTFISATQLTAAIAAIDIASAGTASVAVTSSAPAQVTSGTQIFMINNPAPTAASISPTSSTAGGAAFTLTVNGTGFVTTSVVNFNGVSKTTTFVTPTQLVVAITAADVATPGTASVAVTNPAPGGGTSTNLQLAINNSSFSITSLSPSSATAGGPAFTLVVNGSGFASGSVVKFNGVVKNTTFIGSTQLSTAITTADIATAGVTSVTVTNPGAGTSNAASFTINSASPTISSLSPSSVTAGSAAFTLTVNGAGFLNGAVLQFNGANRTTTFVSNTQVSAAILASDIAAAGSAALTVTNPAPTIGPSAPQVLTISSNSNNPMPEVSSLERTHIAGGVAFTLAVNGAHFVAKSVVNFSGKAEPTTFISTAKLLAAIPASDVATAGPVNVTVMNPAPGGGTSSAFTFTIDGYAISGQSGVSVTSTQPAVIQIMVTPTANGFPNPISFSVSGLPAGTTASFNPAMLTPNGAAAITSLTLTSGSSTASQRNASTGISSSRQLKPLLAMWILAILGWLYLWLRSRALPLMKRDAALALFALILLTGCVLSGCALGVTSSPSTNTSQLTVTATSGTLTQTFGLTETIVK